MCPSPIAFRLALLDGEMLQQAQLIGRVLFSMVPIGQVVSSRKRSIIPNPLLPGSHDHQRQTADQSQSANHGGNRYNLLLADGNLHFAIPRQLLMADEADSAEEG